MSTEPTKLVFVGVGGMGQAAHLKNYLLLDDCEVVACADLDVEKAARVAERHGISGVYGDAEEMLKKEIYDGIVAPQPFQTHHQLLPTLLAYGKPVLIEKPLTSSLIAAERLLEQVKDLGGRVFVGYHKRSDLSTVRAREWIQKWKESGEKGIMTHIRVAMPPGDWMQGGWLHRRNVANQLNVKIPPVEDPDHIHSDAYKTAYVAFVNYYIHQVNLIRFLSGEDYRVTYAGRNGHLLVAELADGTSVSLEMATHSTSLDWDETVEVFFEQGFVRLKLPAPMVLGESGKVEVFENDVSQASLSVYDFPREHAMFSQARNFLNFINGTYPDATPIEDAVKDLEVAGQYLDLLMQEEASCP